MSKIFEDDSDTVLNFKTNNEYAQNYDKWRKKEELNKLKTKYQNEIDSNSSSSESEDDEEGIEITEKVEKEFFKTLACLKNKDPRIYDEQVRFFDDKDDINNIPKKNERNKKSSMYLKDYERNLLLGKGGILSDEDDECADNVTHPTYVEEQQQAKKNLKNALDFIEDKDDGDWGGIFTKREKTKKEKEKEEVDYKMWLAGQKDEINDNQMGSELKPLKEFWNNPNLDDGEKFLRDYILKKQFLDKEDEDYVPTYDEIVHDSDGLSNDEEMLEKQEEFEQKYNFRFEEPDQEFIKRYPRTMENSLRKKDDKRKLKRQEIKERKKKEKEVKMQELKKLQELKRNEIEEKLEKLKEITGNTTLSFANEDIEGEFDPDKYDKRMQELFNDEFYKGPEGVQKPEFPDLDKELEIENWNHFYRDNNEVNNVTHCEDENFIMDCDYDPTAKQTDDTENTKSKKKRKRKSKFAEAVNNPKPKFDPSDNTYEEYFDEYYKLDCEDFIGDIPCRFKYRKVIPNDFGLTIEEILMAKEHELNKWCSLKKAVQIRPEHIEKYDQIAYSKKAQNISLKKKILPSLFTVEENEDNSLQTSTVCKENVQSKSDDQQQNGNDEKKTIKHPEIINGPMKDDRNKKKKKKMNLEVDCAAENRLETSKNNIQNNDMLNLSNMQDSKGTKSSKSEIQQENGDAKKKTTSSLINSESNKVGKSKKKRRLEVINETEDTLTASKTNVPNSDVLALSKRQDEYEPPKKKQQVNARLNVNKKKQNKIVSSVSGKNTLISPSKSKIKKKQNQHKSIGNIGNTKQTRVINDSPLAKISDERLSAYGIKKKRFKNKLKYKK